LALDQGSLVGAGNEQNNRSKQPRDLLERTFGFAVQIRRCANQLPRSFANYEDVRQLVRSSGSVAANYLEAQEGLSRKDFFYRIRICRKEARESCLWLRLLDVGEVAALSDERDRLVLEAGELTRIFSAIAGKDDTGE
jgi:four helix bundle protein